ncbi:cell division protein FtsX [Sphingomonas daechungensis]|uniref:cell division protein FtsX n=1 Tax=Sphingomonas daechungensis TaxID=1176646 RepID=UPI003784E33F
MKLSILAGTEAERRLLPGGTHRGPTPYVIAIMTFAMMIVAAAGLALANAAGIVAGAVEHRYVLQLPDGTSGKLDQAVKAAASVRGVTNVEPVSEDEMRRTLEKWVGPGGLGKDLPVPAIVHLELAPNARAANIAAQLGRALPGSRFIAEEATVAPLLGSLRALRWLAVALVLLMAAATSAAVVLAARGALDTHRSTIEIMHGIGATDEQVALLFQRKIALDAMVGALIGGALAAIALLVIGGGGMAMARELAGGPPLDVTDLVVLAMLPIAAVVLATLVAKFAVLSALHKVI